MEKYQSYYGNHSINDVSYKSCSHCNNKKYEHNTYFFKDYEFYDDKDTDRYEQKSYDETECTCCSKKYDNCCCKSYCKSEKYSCKKWKKSYEDKKCSCRKKYESVYRKKCYSFGTPSNKLHRNLGYNVSKVSGQLWSDKESRSGPYGSWN